MICNKTAATTKTTQNQHHQQAKVLEHFQSRFSESEKVREFANSSNCVSELGIVEINQRVKYIEEICTYTVHQKGCLLKM